MQCRFVFTLIFLIAVFMPVVAVFAQQHSIVFCGENIPVSKEMIATKLMNVIRKQIPNVNMPSLHKRAMAYFPFVSSYLSKYNIPDDFKYLPVIENSFVPGTSSAGAKGIWQLMPDAARDYGLIVNGTVDERDDLEKSTTAACKELVVYYNMIFKKYGISSWVLTAAAYNFGIGNIFKNIQKQGTDYFSMNLNEETANYVYKNIAVKELFEFPELYMKNFGYNIFSTVAAALPAPVADTSMFSKLTLPVGKKEQKQTQNIKLIGGYIKGKYKDFHDGDLVSVQIDEDLQTRGSYTCKGSVIRGTGWVIDDKVYVDLGYGHDVLLGDIAGGRGLPINRLKKDEAVLLISYIQ
ncbi:MAG: lytic transglycosylase domain-containing protein [Bacteroidota bacterium]|nr:lytic transglycosylase domain-containing protein [Bacteroidota bacterium]